MQLLISPVRDLGKMFSFVLSGIIAYTSDTNCEEMAYNLNAEAGFFFFKVKGAAFSDLLARGRLCPLPGYLLTRLVFTLTVEHGVTIYLDTLIRDNRIIAYFRN